MPSEKKINDILAQVFKGTSTEYVVLDRQIVLSPGEYLADIKAQQPIEVSGTVTDAQSGEPLPGVNIVVQGTTTGTTTNMDGEYSIEAPADATLVFSFVGYQEQTIEINSRQEINVAMQQAVTELEEVVAVGYGTQKKSDLTGSIASIDTEEMESMPISSLNEGLQGKVAGAQITQSSGSPGSAVSMLIRGGDSILGGNKPLYVIDGMPVYPSNTDYSPGGSGVGFSSRVPLSVLSTLNANNIESIEVLKDASATAIYGNRGANGVVLITTESGEAGRNLIEFDASYGTQEIANKIEVPTGREFGRYLNLRAETLDEPQVFTQEQLNQLPTYNYQDLIMRTAAIQSYNISLNGGTEDIQYSVSGNYKNQQGIVKNSAFEKFSLRSKLTAKLGDNLEGGINVHGSRINKAFSLSEGNQDQAYSVIRKALAWPSIMPPFDEEGNYYAWDEIRASDVLSEGVNTSWELPKGENPVLLNNEHTDDQILDKLFGNLRLQYTILEGLSFETKAGVDITRSVRDEYWSRLTRYGQVSDIVGGSASVMNVETTKLLNENLLRYNNEFGMHSINAVTGFTIEERIQEGRNMSASGFVTEITKTDDMGGGTQRPSVWSYKNRWGLMSYLGRLNYTLKDRYLFTLTGRADGSSKFSEDHKWGFFPSAAVGWRITEEPFMEDRETISNLKLRLSWGVTGNQEIGTASALATYGSTGYSYGTSQAIGMTPGGVNNPSLEWEKTEQVNVGLDYAMFDNRLRLTADYYQKKTDKLLLDLPLPSSRAVGSIIQNAGALKNKGIEASLRGDIIVGEGFNWSSSVNFSHNENEVTDLAGLERVDAGKLSGQEEEHCVQIMEGYPVGIFFGLQADGIFKSEEEIKNHTTTVEGEEVIIQEGARPGALRIKDRDKDGEITMEDRTVIGDPYPDLTLGWNNQFKYRNFSLRIFLQGETGMDVYNVNDKYTARRRITDVWDPETKPDGKWPRPNADQATIPGRPITSMDLQDASYIRVKNVTLGYDIPSEDVGFLRRARVYVTGKNLITITDYHGYSPDVNSAVQSTFARGIEAGAYPTARIFTAGIKIGL